MPGGVPVGTMAINGSKNAALYAISILSINDEAIRKKLEDFGYFQTKEVLESEL
jgi:5-(carboxyamino)imidazole ribonucleotide mutase